MFKNILSIILIIVFSVFLTACDEAYKNLSKSEIEDIKAMGVDSSWGSVINVKRTDFDIYKDTPAFDNWGGKTFLNKGGTCLGMDVIIKHMHEDIRFDPDGNPSNKDIITDAFTKNKGTIYGYENFRELSEKKPELIKKLMVAGHLKNFHPDSIGKDLLQTVGVETPQGHYNLLQRNLEIGKPAIIGMYNRTDRKIPLIKKLDNGHAIMAYKSIEFENKTVFFVYDPNMVYNEKYNNHRRSAMIYDKKTKTWELYPASYKNMYSDLYPDHLAVESMNTSFDMMQTEVQNGAEFTANEIYKAKEKLNTAFNNYNTALKKGIKKEIENTKTIFENAQSFYINLINKNK